MDEFDHVVVGGGIVGVATALALAEDKRRVALLESAELASGASGGPGMRGVRSNARHPAELRLAAAALAMWPTLDGGLGHPTGFERRGGIELFDAETVTVDGGLERLSIRAAMQERLGVPSRVLDRDEVQARLGAIGPSVGYGILVESDGVAPPAQATAAYAAAARGVGVTFLEGWTVQRLEESMECVVVRADAGTLSARSVALCANVGARALVAESFGSELPLWPVALHAYFLQPEQEWKLPHLIGHDTRPLAAKTVDDGLMQVSGFLKAPWDTVRGASLASDEMFARSERLFREAFPAFPPARIVAREGRRDSFSPDGLQIIDRVPGSRATFVAAGWSGHGFATAPAVGRSLAEWMLTGLRPPLLAPFSADRW